MPTKNKRIHITPSPEFLKWLERKQLTGNGTSIAVMLLNLAEPAIRDAGFVGPLMLERGRYSRIPRSSDWGSDEVDPENSVLFDDDHPNGIW